MPRFGTIENAAQPAGGQKAQQVEMLECQVTLCAEARHLFLRMVGQRIGVDRFVQQGVDLAALPQGLKRALLVAGTGDDQHMQGWLRRFQGGKECLRFGVCRVVVENDHTAVGG